MPRLFTFVFATLSQRVLLAPVFATRSSLLANLVSRCSNRYVCISLLATRAACIPLPAEIITRLSCRASFEIYSVDISNLFLLFAALHSSPSSLNARKYFLLLHARELPRANSRQESSIKIEKTTHNRNYGSPRETSIIIHAHRAFSRLGSAEPMETAIKTAAVQRTPIIEKNWKKPERSFFQIESSFMRIKLAFCKSILQIASYGGIRADLPVIVGELPPTFRVFFFPTLINLVKKTNLPRWR